VLTLDFMYLSLGRPPNPICGPGSPSIELNLSLENFSYIYLSHFETIIYINIGPLKSPVPSTVGPSETSFVGTLSLGTSKYNTVFNLKKCIS